MLSRRGEQKSIKSAESCIMIIALPVSHFNSYLCIQRAPLANVTLFTQSYYVWGSCCTEINQNTKPYISSPISMYDVSCLFSSCVHKHMLKSHRTFRVWCKKVKQLTLFLSFGCNAHLSLSFLSQILLCTS